MLLKEQNDSMCYIDMDLKAFNATVYMTYHRIDNNLPVLLDESRKLLVKHQIKATAINDTTILRANDKVYAVLYTLSGNVASNIQFVATDSVHHFLRGSMHFLCSSKL
jgi:gliding motility-associated lipoprotein GldD